MRSFLFVLAVLSLAGCDGETVAPDGSIDGGPSADAGANDAGSMPCDTPGSSETVSCGDCGTTTRFCTAEGTWAYGTCGGEGECAPGAERSSPCGNCGTQTETCGVACAWEPAGACADEGECAPGTSSRSGAGCPAGQTQDVLCDDACTFQPAGTCRDDSCTTPGQTERVACGMCGMTERFCTASGVWAYGTCEGEGVCLPGTSEPRDCGNCGTQTARCTTSCTWDESAACTGQGECAPGEVTSTTAGCPANQSRPLTCDDACTFQPGACAIDECTPGTMTTAVCGMCGRRVRTCSDARAWVDGPCEDEGVCVAGSTGTAPCGLCGTQPANCTSLCQWQATGTCTGEITCPPQTDVCASTTTLRDYDGTATCSGGVCSYGSREVTCTGGCSAGVCTGPLGLLRGLGGPSGFGTNEVPVTDDGSSPAITLAPTFPSGLRYYGIDYTTVFVNNNGNVSFGADISTVVDPIPGNIEPCIAPWLGDVDTRGGGRPAKNNVAWYQDATRLIVTWHLVGYYNMHDDRQNSFQLILTNRSDVAPGDFDVEMRYERCDWTTGDASSGSGGLGGTEASVGFDSGATDYLLVPGSGTPAILDLCTTSNSGQPGVWRYQVRGGIPQ